MYSRACLKIIPLHRWYHQDLAGFPEKDETLVGERGMTLSGGQRARIGLSRAVYADADLVLMDDPLSAVDASVGKYLFDKLVLSPLSA